MHESESSRPSLMMFSFDYPPREGGISRMCSEIGMWLALRSDLVIVTERGTGRPTENQVAVGIDVVRLTPGRPRRELGAWWKLLGMRRGRTVIVGTR